MIRILFAVFVSLFFNAAAYANGYCDSRPNQAERQRCYAANNDMNERIAIAAVTRMRSNEEAIRKAEKIPAADKQAFLQELQAKKQNVDRICKTNQCVTSQAAALNNEMAAFYRKYYPKG